MYEGNSKKEQWELLKMARKAKTTKSENANKSAYTREIQLGANGYYDMPTRESQLKMPIRITTRTTPHS